MVKRLPQPALRLANHESAYTTGRYDRRGDQVNLYGEERIAT